MSNNKKCKGCGIALQNEHKSAPGYLPEEVIKNSSNKELICQRCFRLANYNEYIPLDRTARDYKKVVNDTLKKVKVVLAVFDIIDFESSFDNEILDILREKDSIIIINKFDLIPNGKHASEVSNWVKARLGNEGIVPLDIAIVSAKNCYGINGIIRKLRHFYPNGVNSMVVGTTNVGKSSIINRLLKDRVTTISKYPGTTLKSIKNSIPNSNINIIDTPGLIPNGRISDLVCEECHLKTVSTKEISRKTFKSKQNQVILIGGLVKLKILNSGDVKPIFTIFASKNVTFHETNENRVDDLIKDHTGTLITPPCSKCIDIFYSIPTLTKTYDIGIDKELVVKGVGWISIKRGPLKIEVTLPEKVDVIIRDAFIKPKRA